MPRTALPAAALLAGLSLSPLLQAGEDAAWSYAGERGPAHWGELAPEFAACTAGHNQSPVALDTRVAGELPALTLDYAAVGRERLNDGHTLKVRYPAGNVLRLDEADFALKQVHFHAPSEHTLDGRHYPLEAHLVHASADGEFAVLAVLFEQGQALAAFGEDWTAPPGEAGVHDTLADGLDAGALLPEGRDYYRLNGSLTTPPCTEGVRWLVMQQPVEASAAQLEALAEALGEANNRPLQPRNARLIVE